MIHIRPGSQVYEILTLLSIVGEFPTCSLHLLGSERVYKALVSKLTEKQECCHTETGEVITTKVLTISGKSSSKTIRLFRKALPILGWLGAEQFYHESYPNHKFSGSYYHVVRNHRVAEVVAVCMKAGLEIKPYKLPKLQGTTITNIIDKPTFYPSRILKEIYQDDLNKTNEILVYVDSELSDAEAKSIGTKINMVDNVLQATFVSREQALEDFIADHQDDDAFSGVEATDLRHRFVVVLEDNALMEQTDMAIKMIPGVAKTNAAYELAEGFTTLQNVLHIASAAVIAVLLVVSLLIISNTVKLAMYDRKDEISIMKMVGATNGFIRLPFIVEGFILGMLGAVAAFLLEWVMYDALIARIDAIDSLQLFSFVPFTELLAPMVLTFGGAGLFVGIVGSWTSIRKFMDV